MNNLMFRLLYKFIKYKETLIKAYYQALIARTAKVLGSDIHINGKFKIIHPAGLIIGNNVHIGENAFIHARGGVIIGSNTHISRNVTIYSVNHNYESNLIPYNSELIPRSVVIEEGVWIGMNVSITPGVNIGHGAIIGLGAIISKNVEAGSIVVGNNKIIGRRSLDTYSILKNNNQFSGVNGSFINHNVLNTYKSVLYPSNQFKKKIIFVLSTGRAGSTLIAKLLNKSNEICANHESFYSFLNIICAKYICGKLTREQTKSELIKLFRLSPLVQNDTHYLESDQKLVPLLEIISELFPEAYYIWLIRNPYQFSLSATSRGWFSDSDTLTFTHDNLPIIKPQLSSDGLRNYFMYINYNNYNIFNLTQFERNILYWKYWNNMISTFFNKIASKNKLFLRLEYISKDIDLLFQFVGINKPKKIITKKINIVKKKDKKSYHNLINNLENLKNNQRVEIIDELRSWYPDLK